MTEAQWRQLADLCYAAACWANEYGDANQEAFWSAAGDAASERHNWHVGLFDEAMTEREV